MGTLALLARRATRRQRIAAMRAAGVRAERGRPVRQGSGARMERASATRSHVRAGVARGRFAPRLRWRAAALEGRTARLATRRRPIAVRPLARASAAPPALRVGRVWHVWVGRAFAPRAADVRGAARTARSVSRPPSQRDAVRAERRAGAARRRRRTGAWRPGAAVAERVGPPAALGSTAWAGSASATPRRVRAGAVRVTCATLL